MPYAKLRWIEILGKRVYDPTLVLMEIGDDMLIGHEIMQQINLSIDLKNHRISIIE